jgi:hypothetical protein
VNPHPHRELVLINAAGFLRSLGVGLMGVVLGIYLFSVGLSSFAIGLIIAAPKYAFRLSSCEDD